MTRPNSCTNLKKAIVRYCAEIEDPLRLGRAMANVVLGQMLPDGVIKGGSSLLFRYGGSGTRYTRDVDTARSISLEEYISKLRANLTLGWNGFTGHIVELTPFQRPNISPEYLMFPFDIKLNYNNKPWQTVRIEVGYNEIDDANIGDLELPQDIANAFEALGFPKPNKVRVMKLSHQIAQKLHAVSEEGSSRAHDLIDLQLIHLKSTLDYNEVKSVCKRLFAYRKKQMWPPKIKMGDDWETLYANTLNYLTEKEGILAKADDAVKWVNDLIQKIDRNNP